MGIVGMCPGMIGTIGMGRYDMSASTQVTMMTVSCKGGAVSDDLPTTIDPAAQRLTMDTSSLPLRNAHSRHGHGQWIHQRPGFDVQPFTIKSQLGGYEVWQVINPTGMDHPFHAHLNSFQVLGITGGTPTMPGYIPRRLPGKMSLSSPKWAVLRC